MREIKFRFFDNHREMMIVDDNLNISNCNYDNIHARFVPDSKFQTVYNFDFSRCEVIGNIHENKELLK